MPKCLFWVADQGRRMDWAARELEEAGQPVTRRLSDACTHLVLPLPVRAEPAELSPLLTLLGPGKTLLGGRLGELKKPLEATGASVLDYFEDESLICTNAALTAEGAVFVLMNHCSAALSGLPVLVCGWGRIGKLLAGKLRALGAKVTVSARKGKDLAMLRAAGFSVIRSGDARALPGCRAVFNTVPAAVYTPEQLALAHPQCIFIDLATASGLRAPEGREILTAPGLPGLYAPETAGRLIGKTLLRLLKEE